jgi:lipid-binding SYLF domain-containing protein
MGSAARGLLVGFVSIWVLASGSIIQKLHAADAREIDAGVSAALDQFYLEVPSALELSRRAAGILVFPTIVKAGFGIGGEYGEGALRVNGRTVDYYNTISASIGFQLGIQAKSVIIMFLTNEALDRFYRKDGWKIGVDGSVVLVTLGAGGVIDSDTIKSPIVGFIFDQKGLMYNLTLEGSKISRIYR